MGILELIEQFEDEFYPISDEKKTLLANQPIQQVIACLSEMASWHECGGRLSW
ncbi:phage protein [Streptococcus pneumoniae]|nr:phage protein [Streptococcus pneumoniae]